MIDTADSSETGSQHPSAIPSDIVVDLEKNDEYPQPALETREVGSGRNGGDGGDGSPAPTSEDKAEVVAVELPEFMARFDKGDPEDPQNWNTWFKAYLTLVMGLLAFAGSAGTSIVTPTEGTVAECLNVSLEATVLMLALFVLGFAFGPMLWAPISEAYGRRWSMLPPVFVLGLWSIGTATSRNLPAILVTRFFGGVFGSAPVSNVAAALGDFWSPQRRGTAMSFYAICVVGGPTVSPLVGAAVTINRRLGWRWAEYIEAIVAFTSVAVAFFTMPETSRPVLLKHKARRLRKETGDLRWWHPQEKEGMNLNNIVTKHLSRPVRMFFTEPMVTCIALYASFVYGLLFLNLEVFPIVFREHRGYGPVVSTLPFLGLFVGVLFAVLVSIANDPFYRRAVIRNKGRPAPEGRLPPMVVGGVFFSAGLFWFGWTAAPEFSWVLPTVAAAFIGSGFTIVFQQCLNFLVDTYGPYAASATSANTVLRSLLACALPLVARPMFLNMGVGPAASVLAGISCLALPVPFIFMKYGKRLRMKSKFAPVIED